MQVKSTNLVATATKTKRKRARASPGEPVFAQRRRRALVLAGT